MSDNSNTNRNSFFNKWKNSKVNRTAVISGVLVVAALIAVVAITVSMNRSKKDDLPPVDSGTRAPETTAPQPEETDPPATEPADTRPPSGGVSKPVEDKLPSFVLPVKGAILKKHDATLQVYSVTMGDYRVHLGIDVVTEENAPVYAAADGKIQKIWEDVKMGYCIAVQHTGDCVTVYKNLGETLPEGISEGVSVRSGQLIATVGNSAMIEVAEEPHLHFEMTVGGLSVDPLEYYDDKALEALNIDSSFEE